MILSDLYPFYWPPL